MRIWLLKLRLIQDDITGAIHQNCQKQKLFKLSAGFPKKAEKFAKVQQDPAFNKVDLKKMRH